MLYKLLFSALALEAGSLALMLGQDTNLAVLVFYFVLHGAASLLMALAIRLMLPRHYAEPRSWVVSFLFSYNFFMPVAGMLCAVLGFLLGMWLPRLGGSHGFGIVSTPRFTTHRNHEGAGFRGGQLRAQLVNAETPLEQRLKALVALQDTPAHASGSMLRHLLSDPADDIRLLAYGILDSKEKQIMQRIQENLRALERGSDDLERYGIHKRVAELYCELIYQDLVHGDMRTFAAEQVRLHGGMAQVHDASDAGLWFMLARLALQGMDLDTAEIALKRAEEWGFAAERLLPYVAELRFLQGRYGELRRLFGELGSEATLPAVRAMREYWAWDGMPVVEFAFEKKMEALQ